MATVLDLGSIIHVHNAVWHSLQCKTFFQAWFCCFSYTKNDHSLLLEHLLGGKPMSYVLSVIIEQPYERGNMNHI